MPIGLYLKISLRNKKSCDAVTLLSVYRMSLIICTVAVEGHYYTDICIQQRDHQYSRIIILNFELQQGDNL